MFFVTNGEEVACKRNFALFMWLTIHLICNYPFPCWGENMGCSITVSIAKLAAYPTWHTAVLYLLFWDLFCWVSDKLRTVKRFQTGVIWVEFNFCVMSVTCILVVRSCASGCLNALRLILPHVGLWSNGNWLNSVNRSCVELALLYMTAWVDD